MKNDTGNASRSSSSLLNVDSDVELFDKGRSLGLVTMTGPTTWTMQVSSLDSSSHTFVAKDKSSSGTSLPWEISVVSAIKPSISSVKDSQGNEIPEGGSTTDTTVRLTGKAAAGQKIEIWNMEVLVDIVQVDNAEDWGVKILSLKANDICRIKVRGLYGGQPESEQRTFTVYVIVTGFEDFMEEQAQDLKLNMPVLLNSGLSATLRASGAGTPPRPALIGGQPGILMYFGMYGTSTVEFSIPGVCKSVRIRYQHVGANCRVIFHSVNGSVLGETNVTQNRFDTGYVKFEYPQGLIHSFIIQCVETSGFDNFPINCIFWR